MGTTMEGVGGARVVIPDGPEAPQEVGRCVPVKVEGRGYEFTT